MPYPSDRERDRPWVIRTYAGHSSAATSNELYRRNLAKGQTGLSVAFDLPTQTGYDPDHELARGEVGRVGVPIAHLGDVADRHADLADLARGERIVAVVPGLGGQIEGDREAGLALREVQAIELVARPGARVARVGAHDPRLFAVHGLVLAVPARQRESVGKRG